MTESEENEEVGVRLSREECRMGRDGALRNTSVQGEQ